MSLHILGIRHHGPGSSRHVLDALAALQPDMILIEGPPEGEAILQWVNHADMKPPVALLAYVPDNPKQAVFYPFTAFSPEWNAISYGLEHKVPVRFIDMPLIHGLAEQETITPEQPEAPIENVLSEEEPVVVEDVVTVRRNPLGYLAEIAGFEDEEEWWEHHFEIARHPLEVFTAVESSMTALRAELPAKEDKREAIREAFMRKAIRKAQKEMYACIVVVCGAWHVPALSTMPSQKEDDALIRGLPKVKVETTWIPWTDDRLSFASGYGAGLESPGWYRHVWAFPEDNGARWLAHTARIFREHKVDISSAHIIESVRLANNLAAMRGLSRPGLKEFSEATQAVMCMGDGILMKLIHRELIVGKELGQVPEGTPQVPLQRDLDQAMKKFRMKISNEDKALRLDLREENDLQKSILLHRLQLLDIDWGKMQHSSSKGTFKEEWVLRWYPELTISLLEKAPWGNTVEMAAGKYLEHIAAGCSRLDDITAIVQKALPADLHTSVDVVMRKMDELAAGTSDTIVLMNAFIPLVQVSRYGNVRKTDQQTISLILTAIFYRIVSGLPVSCTGIDEDQALQMVEKISEVNSAVLLLDDDVLKDAWTETIRKVIALELVAPMVQGYSCKVLYDARILNQEATANEFSKALSVNNEPSFSTNWLEGFLKDAATVLILDDTIWNIVNGWLLSLEENAFLQVIPLLRRTFATYNNVEKNKIAMRAKQGGTQPVSPAAAADLDEQRGRTVLPVLEKLMGL